MGCLACWRLPLASRQYAAEHDLVDRLWLKVGALQGRANGGGAQLRGCEVFQVALEPAHRGAGACDDDDWIVSVHNFLRNSFSDRRSARRHAQSAVEADDLAVQHRVFTGMPDQGCEFRRSAET